MSRCVLHRLHAADNVAVALVDLQSGSTISLDSGQLVLSEPIPFGHKVALVDIAAGTSVVKYGEQIGLASRDIRGGQHVHVHNIVSTRGRGDLAVPVALSAGVAPADDEP